MVHITLQKLYIMHLTIQTKEIAAHAKAGQFVSVYSDDASKLLPRPISLCGIDAEAGTLRLVYRVTGEGTGTEEFSRLKKGDTVKIVSMGLKGTVSTLPDAKGALFVQCGIMRTQTNVKDLVLIDEVTINTPTLQRTGAGKIKMSKSLSVSTEINLLGKTVDEALSELDKYLDDAYLAHLPSVRVVHGKGTGALRNAVHNHLKRLKYVKEFRLGEYGEGDAGVTIVTFK